MRALSLALSCTLLSKKLFFMSYTRSLTHKHPYTHTPSHTHKHPKRTKGGDAPFCRRSCSLFVHTLSHPLSLTRTRTHTHTHIHQRWRRALAVEEVVLYLVRPKLVRQGARKDTENEHWWCVDEGGVMSHVQLRHTWSHVTHGGGVMSHMEESCHTCSYFTHRVMSHMEESCHT